VCACVLRSVVLSLKSGAGDVRIAPFSLNVSQHWSHNTGHTQPNSKAIATYMYLYISGV